MYKYIYIYIHIYTSYCALHVQSKAFKPPARKCHVRPPAPRVLAAKWKHGGNATVKKTPTQPGVPPPIKLRCAAAKAAMARACEHYQHMTALAAMEREEHGAQC